jgi:hypothetical protein
LKSKHNLILEHLIDLTQKLEKLSSLENHSDIKLLDFQKVAYVNSLNYCISYA